MSDATTTYLMGYGSWAIARLRAGKAEPNVSSTKLLSSGGGTILPMLSATYSRNCSVPTASTYHIPMDDSKRTTIRLGSGTYSYSGDISFEWTDQMASLIFGDSASSSSLPDFFSRRSFLDMVLCDGEGYIDIQGAVWSSFNLTGQTNSLISSSLSFSTCNGYVKDIEVTDVTNGSSRPSWYNINNVDLEPYWQYGEEGVESFTLSFSRQVQPIYLNETVWKGPSYLRVGMMEANFQLTCWEEWFDTLSLTLGRKKKIVFNSSAFMSQRSYQFSGIQGNGTKTYTLNALGQKQALDLFKFETAN